ncbi:flagellar hook capping FlgD N-terminal domain-containing protein [Octadecabacter sp. 1_MG-2023]|uniref:flagellar hook capping FlgD N-terminal domain-containing protein n=1 Tax=unclassified Octadecabacter TaxID=196158 RepID=UPI001C0962C7|nr:MULTISPECIES: flagellar hook capping FlgD N-terminal domain-containing protein [unclassified Octadecabacter]MBU2992399.1 flagellar hook assembly protein FlgD [Octadecabacter sp. B2R22]MDO6734844.1 flagellar hook capping FlgD N-terminal domain-containing protein [Octadecabacter sp. 1_MG-2023]
MEISSVATSASFVPTTETSEAVISSDFETFLKMLTVQMENQDPLNPTDSAEYAQQLATFSGVEQAVLTNELLTSMMVQMNTSGMAQMADWVGNEARVAAPAHFDGSPITIAPNPAAVADTVELVVYDESGDEVQRTALPLSADPVEWAGTSTDGTPFPTGTYTFNVESFSNGEVILNETADVYARVNEVRSENGESVLILEGGVAVLASDVSALREG